MAEFGFDSTTDEVLEGHDLGGKIVLVTGGYSGLGRETARAMGAKGAHVILSGRDEAKLTEAAQELAEETGATFDTLVCDLASLESVRAAAKEASDRFDKLDLLINNAGVMACPKRRNGGRLRAPVRHQPSGPFPALKPACATAGEGRGRTDHRAFFPRAFPIAGAS